MSLRDKINRCNVDLDVIGDVFSDDVEAAADFSELLPGGVYVMTATGTLAKSSTGTASYRLVMTVVEPAEYAGRRCWYDIWLTKQAMGMAKRDFLRLGFKNMSELERESPEWTLEVRVGIEDDEKYGQKNRVRGFKVIESRAQEADPFAAGIDSEGGAL